MKVAVIGDVHLGANYSLGTKDIANGNNTRLLDYQNTLLATMDYVIELGCKQLCFTGDIFEHRSPSLKEQELFSYALRYGLESGLDDIHVSLGNHDQNRVTGASTLSYIKELPLEHIHIHDDMDVFTVYENGEAKINLIFMPYRDRRWLNCTTSAEAIEKIDEQLTFCLASIGNDAKKMVVGHMTIENTLWMLDKYDELYNNSNELLLPVSMFDSVDITVMGHVHTPGLVSNKPLIIYSGSMEKRGAFEDHKKKYLVVDVDEQKINTYDEPCREIFDISLDFSGSSHGESVTDDVIKRIDSFAEGNDLKDSIVRVILTLKAEDDKFCSIKLIESHLYNNHYVHWVPEIKPSLTFSRQARDVSITEQSSDTDSFKRYVERQFASNENLDELIEAGLEIIRSNGEST